VTRTFDLIVVGGGPAGCACAERAAGTGLSTLVIEKSSFPRSKPCAAGLTFRSLALLGGRSEPLAHRRLFRAGIVFGDGLALTVESPDVLVATTTRRQLDAGLADDAATAGARFEFASAVESIELERNAVRVRAGGREWRAAYAVVADGARGGGRRALGLRPLTLGGGLYVRAYPGSRSRLEPFSDRVWFDPTAAARGYGWIFPKSDHLNVGIFSQRPLSVRYSQALERFLRLYGLERWRLEGPTAFPIPVRRPRDADGTGLALFAGDAAGLADPITGEGIAWALASGRTAAEEVARALGDGSDALSSYSERVTREIVPGLDAITRKGNFVYSLGPDFLGLAARMPLVRALFAPLWRAASRRSGDVPRVTVTPCADGAVRVRSAARGRRPAGAGGAVDGGASPGAGGTRP